MMTSEENTIVIKCEDAATFCQQIGDASVSLIFTSPPYYIGKSYDSSRKLEDFRLEIQRMIPHFARILKSDGSLCWQVGNHVANGVITPLDSVIIQEMLAHSQFKLRNRIIWTFNHGAHSRKRFSGRHETILWYTQSDTFQFNLDAVRVPQIYPGKKAYKGKRRGQWSGNPLGKNPGDVWDIPNVKAKHPEKTAHPCQFPVALPIRFIKALTKVGDTVVDPYLGSGSTAIAASASARSFLGCDISAVYVDIARRRMAEFEAGTVKIRDDKPARKPRSSEAVARIPSHFQHQG